jgi:hypothetical protein
MEQPKITLIAKDGKAEAQILTGSHFQVLTGEVHTIYETNVVSEFIKFINPMVDIFVYYNEVGIYAFRKDMEYNEGPVAKCVLENSTTLDALLCHVNNEIDLKPFEKFLLAVRKKIDKNGVDLLDRVKSFKISKVTEIIRQKDQQANYLYSIKREGTQEDVIFPDTITFDIKLFKYHNYTIELEFDVYFDYKQHEDSVGVKFNLVNFEANDIIQDRKIAVLEGELKDFGDNVFWGRNALEMKTDSWKYLSNPIR